MLRLLIFAVFMLLMSSICNGQGKTSFGDNAVNDTSFTVAQLKLNAYGGGADTMILIVLPNGTVKKVAKSAFSGGGLTLQDVLDNGNTATGKRIELTVDSPGLNHIVLKNGLYTSMAFIGASGRNFTMGIGGNGTPLRDSFFIFDGNNNRSPLTIVQGGVLNLGGLSDQKPVISLTSNASGDFRMASLWGRVMLRNRISGGNTSDSTLVIDGDTIKVIAPVTDIIEQNTVKIYNVDNYGATPHYIDSTDDDAAAIQEAIDSCRANGFDGTVTFSDGIYHLRNNKVVPVAPRFINAQVYLPWDTVTSSNRGVLVMQGVPSNRTTINPVIDIGWRTSGSIIKSECGNCANIDAAIGVDHVSLGSNVVPNGNALIVKDMTIVVDPGYSAVTTKGASYGGIDNVYATVDTPLADVQEPASLNNTVGIRVNNLTTEGRSNSFIRNSGATGFGAALRFCNNVDIENVFAGCSGYGIYPTRNNNPTHLGKVNIFDCRYPVATLDHSASDSLTYFDIEQLTVRNYTTNKWYSHQYTVYDSFNIGIANIIYQMQDSSGEVNNSTFSKFGGNYITTHAITEKPLFAIDSSIYTSVYASSLKVTKGGDTVTDTLTIGTNSSHVLAFEANGTKFGLLRTNGRWDFKNSALEGVIGIANDQTAAIILGVGRGTTTTANNPFVAFTSTGALAAGSARLRFNPSTGAMLTDNVTTFVAPITPAINNQSGTTYALQSSDNGKVIVITNASPITVTVPSGLPIGFNVLVEQGGAGKITFATSGTTINNLFSFSTTSGQYAVATLYSKATDTYNLSGNLE